MAWLQYIYTHTNLVHIHTPQTTWAIIINKQNRRCTKLLRLATHSIQLADGWHFFRHSRHAKCRETLCCWKWWLVNRTAKQAPTHEKWTVYRGKGKNVIDPHLGKKLKQNDRKKENKSKSEMACVCVCFVETKASLNHPTKIDNNLWMRGCYTCNMRTVKYLSLSSSTHIHTHTKGWEWKWSNSF